MCDRHNITRQGRWLERIIVFTLRFLLGTSLSSPTPPPSTSWTFHGLSRSEFTTKMAVATAMNWVFITTTTSRPSHSQPSSPSASSSPIQDIEIENKLEFPLRFLPNSGGWGLLTTVSQFNSKDDAKEEQGEEEEESFSYLAIVDTGSPFLTAPGPVKEISRTINDTQDTAATGRGASPSSSSIEQYGATKGDIEWRQVDMATWIGTGSSGGGVAERTNLIVGIVLSTQFIREMGGLFCGLILQDDQHPTWIQQMGLQYRHLRLNLTTKNPTLILSNQPFQPKAGQTRNDILTLYDLSLYGPDLYHYAVLAETLVVEWQNGTSIVLPPLKRPIVIVLDTGLTGCIIHDSLANELNTQFTTETIKGIQVMLPTISGSTLTLKSHPEYWRLDCFHLPWFYEDQKKKEKKESQPQPLPPHIIAIGATFWAGVESLTIDTISRQASIEVK